MKSHTELIARLMDRIRMKPVTVEYSQCGYGEGVHAEVILELNCPGRHKVHLPADGPMPGVFQKIECPQCPWRAVKDEDLEEAIILLQEAEQDRWRREARDVTAASQKAVNGELEQAAMKRS